MSVCTPFAYIAVQMALKAAIELNVFDILAESGPPGTQLTAPQIASKIPTTNPIRAAPALHRILRFLSSNSFLTTTLPPNSTNDEQERLFGLTPLTSCTLVRSSNNGTNHTLPIIGSLLLLHCQKEMFESLDKLKYAVLCPGPATSPFEMVYGVGWYDYLAQKPDSKLNLLFYTCMGSSYSFFCDSLMKVYRGFDQVIELMDVGGNDGSALEHIISLHPQIEVCINFDLPHVIARAPLRKGVEHVAGDMFETLPNSKTIMLKRILHNWSDEMCVKLLQNCWRSLPEAGGKVIVLEMLVPENFVRMSETTTVTTDLFMLALCAGGKERTLSELQELATAAGFSDVVNAVPIDDGLYVLEFLK